MDFGVTLQTNPPASRVIELTRRAEELGFGYAWTFDSHILWQEPYVIHSQMLSATERIMVGPLVTNPVSRDPSVTASTFATLNDTFGNRTICGIGRGDSVVRVLGRKPTTLRQLEDATHVIKELAEGREVDYSGVKVSIPWVSDGKLDVWMAGYGPRALGLVGRKADGFILQLADLVARYGEDSDVPHALTDYIRARQGYDYSHHGKSDNPTTDFVPDDIVDRFCVLGTVEDHVKKLNELRDLGADQFNVYLMHDAMDKTLEAYGEEIIPALGAKSA